MDKLIRFTILTTLAGVILAFNMYHADYKLLVAQVGTIIAAAMMLLSGSKIINRTMLVFLGVCVLSFILSPHKLASGQGLYKVGAWVVFGMAVSSPQLTDEKFRRDIVNVWLVCAGIVAVYGILQFFGMDFMRFRLPPGQRIVSNFGNPTLLAGFIAMTMPVVLTRVLERRKIISYQKLSVIALLIVMLICLFLTKSRAGILAAMLGIGVVAALLKIKQEKILILLFSGAILSGLLLLMFPQTREVVFNIILRKTARFSIWRDTFMLVRANPVMGTGIGTFSLYFPQVVSQDVLNFHFIGVDFVNHAHSEYLEILSEMGILGVAGFLAVIAMSIHGFLKREQKSALETGLFAAFVAVLFHNLVSVDLRYTSTGMFFWMMVGILGTGHIKDIGAQSTAVSAYRKIFNTLIILIAIIAVYFTAKPYIRIQGIKMQEFFVKEEVADKKIQNLMVAGRDDVDYLFSLGVLHAKKKDFKKAYEYFGAVLNADPLHAGAYNNIGNLTAVEGDIEGAKGYFQKAIEFEPDNVEYLLNLSSCYFMLNEMEKASSTLEEALRIDPDNSRALLLYRQMEQ